MHEYPQHLVLDAGGWAERANPDRPALRSRLLLEGLHDLGLQMTNVSTRELALGPDALRVLADSVGVQLLSANILWNDKPYFRPWVLLRRELGGRTISIGVTAVTVASRGWTNAWPDSVQLVVSDPLLAAQRAFAELESQSDLQILLAYAPVTTLDGWSSSLPGYDLLVAGAGDLRDPPEPGPLPYVAAPGTKCKNLLWAVVRPTATGFVLREASVRALDAKVPDDAETAARVAALKARLGEGGAQAAGASPGTPAATAAPH
jgi:2',3'-cyclic-nucleotide 2'-phosphodiesterase (5'-nucleotidase family)